MPVKQLQAGGDRNFTYLAFDAGTKKAAVVDPSYGSAILLKHVKDEGLQVEYVINTHSHFDHVQDNDVLLRETGGRLIAWGMPGIEDGSIIPLGTLQLRILHTPGHTPDSICVLLEGEEVPHMFTGDTLFVGKVGGTREKKAAQMEYESLHRLMQLPPETVVWPGHDYGTSPRSTIGRERETNPFLLQRSFEDFLHLKEHWAEYKRAHGIR